ncbi:PREDICTED: UTP--glucose-1-phosphate uridylyltransferase-like [Amphimedon queenslandica]|uniref:UTP--glucose-1-phosphate uridylyltransferase n=1 Tax=Amphimedon queenslandica TaxID=400682 RepID=A0AAN0J7N9_AMPQE|nr:PREDICTED: UTP--glucose-1-phosphate uridylyltransferase-like [Amphimedon queenslandica]|eukprot:XP_019853045.1 PREDICTED: UTP--glucose-1-phosphate uridylyltransferase-like [Amphimedon queenslandica]
MPVEDYCSLPSVATDQFKFLLSKLIVIKLNGGLGTSMGCVGPKSLIQVRNDATFLDLTVQQIEQLNQKYGTDVPLVLMNSYNTNSETARIKHKYERRVNLYVFDQSYYPRINQETLRPIPEKPDYKDGEWYPPGHGDIYISLKRSGLLDQFVKEGKELMFVSNIDNLGATVDLSILSHFVSNRCEFVMEVTDKTRSDVKGGTLIQYEDKVQLLEIAQVPKDKVDEFKSISKFRVFNTNNLWISLSAVDRLLSTNGMTMDIIVNKKCASARPMVSITASQLGFTLKEMQNEACYLLFLLL